MGMGKKAFFLSLWLFSLLYRKFLGISHRAKNAPQGCARFCCGIMSLNATGERRRISRCDILCSEYDLFVSYSFFIIYLEAVNCTV